MINAQTMILLVGLAGSSASGCAATWAMDSAPTADGQSMYVVGRRQNPSSVWLCPQTPGHGECRRVRVTFR